MAKKITKAQSQRISRIYGQRCSGVQIDIMDIGKVFKVAENAIAASDISDADLGDTIVAYVNQIRRN